MAFSYYKTFTTDHTQCGTADSTNFPICLNVTDTDLKSVGNGGFVQNTNGYDIRPFSDSGLTAALSFELVFYDPTTGQLEMHTKVATLDHLSDVIYYLAFGDAGISTDGSSTATWNSNYLGVYHYKDGTTLSVADATAQNNGTNHSCTATTGQIDGAAAGNGTTAFVDDGNITAINGAAHFTAGMWIYPDDTLSASLKGILSKWDGSTGFFMETFTSNTDLGIAFSGGNFQTSAGAVFTAFTKLRLDWVFDGTLSAANKSLVYANGSLVTMNTTGTVPSTLGTNSSSVIVFPTDSARWHGWIDELRLSLASLSSSWITAEYNNQKSSSTFLTWGAKTSTGYRVLFIRS